MNGELEQLRELIEKSRAGQGGRWRCPPELRCRIATYMRERRMVGASLESIAVVLGVSESSVSRWIAPPVPDRASIQLREVQIGGAASTASAAMVLVTPRGYRLEGLSESAALRLLREL